jgi:hypothetical protein
MARQSGQWLAEERKQHGRTQSQLAEIMGRHPGKGLPDRARPAVDYRGHRPLHPGLGGRLDLDLLDWETG